MFQHSPKFKLDFMIPLSMNKKQIIEDEPSIEIETARISFNEQMIVCKYKPTQKVTHIQKTISQLKGNSELFWINPAISNEYQKKSRSILKNSSPTSPQSLSIE